MYKSKSLVIVLLCASLAFVSAEKESSCKCPAADEGSEICASDKRTYASVAQMECVSKCTGKSLTMVDQRSCDCVCANSREFRPVCGSDNKTYVNPGAIRCHNRCYYNKIVKVDTKPCHRDETRFLPF